PEIEADRVRRLADRISGRRGLGAFVGLFLDLGLEFALRFIRWDVVEDLDVHILEALECGTQVGRRANVLGEETVDLVKSQVALLAPELDETLWVFPFVLLLHAPKLPYWPPSRVAGAIRQSSGTPGPLKRRRAQGIDLVDLDLDRLGLGALLDSQFEYAVNVGRADAVAARVRW